MRLAAAILLCLFCAAKPGAAADLKFVHARIYSAPGQPPIAEGTILIHNGRIVAVGPSASIKDLSPDPQQILYDCRGMAVTAGFWNSHVHIFTPGLLHAEHTSNEALQAQLQGMFTQWGFTTVFDLASILPNTNLIRGRIANGTVKGPRILTVGEPFYGKGGVPIYIQGFLAENHISIPEADSIPEAVARVHQQIHDGADAIKIFAGSIEAHDVLLMRPDLASAIVTAAHREHKLVFAHPSNRAGVELSLASRVDILAHVALMDGPWPPDLVARMLAAHISLIPTLTLFDVEARKANLSREEDQRWIDLAVLQLRSFSSAGGTILFGTDVGYTDHVDTAEEFSLMSAAGLSFPQILASLTTNPAQRFGYDAHSGRIAPGMDADLVVLKQDPATDITALAHVAATIRGGTIIFSAP